MLAISEAICRYRDGAGDRRPAVPRPRHARALRAGVRARSSRCSPRTASTSCVDADGGSTPTPVISHAILTHNRGGGARHRRRDRRHAVAQPARRRRLQVQPAARRAGRHRRHRLDRATRPTRCSRPGSTTSSACRTSDAAVQPPRLRDAPTSTTCRGDRPRRDPRRRRCASASTRSAARASPTGQAIAERHGLDLTIVNDEVDPTFRFVPLDWDGKIRMDCSSPYAMARLRELARPLRRRLRQRPRRRPPRDRHAAARAAEPEPPPRGLHRLPVRRRARLGPDVGIGKTLVLERDHRPRRRRPRPPARRGAGRLQVVRRRAARRLARLRRRGERGRLVPAPRRRRRGRPTRTG